MTSGGLHKSQSERNPGYSRTLICGTSGAGKSSLARLASERLGVPYTELDSLHHGPNWTRRETFLQEVEDLANQEAWVTEWQYADARPLLADRAQCLVYLDYSRLLVMSRVVRRTLRRWAFRERLWNDNVEPPLRKVLTDPNHILRWAWRTHGEHGARVAELAASRPDLDVVTLRSHADANAWLASLQHVLSPGR